MSSASFSSVETLPAVQRLALTYAPRGCRSRTAALFALDARLAELVRGASEPMLGQLRLSWWREALNADSARWPAGDPILDAVRTWTETGTEPAKLVVLVDGWEELTAPPPLSHAALARFAEGRGKAFAALARALGEDAAAPPAQRAARQWALVDSVDRLSRAEERAVAIGLVRQEDWGAIRLPRALRPLSVLHALARSRVSEEGIAPARPVAALGVAIRAGLLGR